MHTQSECYNANNIITPVGIVVHSTGANNKTTARYCAPSDNDPNYTELLNTIGTNRYGNHWNRTGVKTAVHYFVGTIKAGGVACVQTLPENIACWGVGKGSNGSYNYNPTAHIQFEVCEDDRTNRDYFDLVYKESTELCADICKRYGWNANVIVSHKEAHAKGYGSNHGDIDHWLKCFGLTMKDYRAEVQRLLDEMNKPKEEEKPVEESVKNEGYKPEVGEVVYYAGTAHYSSSNKTAASYCTPGEAKCTRIYNGKHPYHLVRTSGETGVYGWVDAEFIRKLDKPVQEEVKEEPKEDVIEPAIPEVEEPKQDVTPEVPKTDVEQVEPETPVEDVTTPDVEESEDVVVTPNEPKKEPKEEPKVEPKEEPKVEPQPTTKYGWFKKILTWIVNFIRKAFKKK
jgi:N-acetyl-anhydromuramyl-L-alanine amidase AmpD